jgi:hypothetical protein
MDKTLNLNVSYFSNIVKERWCKTTDNFIYPHHQVVPTSLKSTVHGVKIILFYCDDEISVIYLKFLIFGSEGITYNWVQVLGVGWWRG